jgi:hypothetical protein
MIQKKQKIIKNKKNEKVEETESELKSGKLIKIINNFPNELKDPGIS